MVNDMDNKNSLTSGELKEIMHYDPDTGVFTWKRSIRKRDRWNGKIAGSIMTLGYRQIRINGRDYYAHRLAWLYMTGEWPQQTIDHINGKQADNRWSNLRDVSHHANIQNVRIARRNNKSGLLGAYFHKDHPTKPWQARLQIQGICKSLGYFSTSKEAHDAYLKAKRRFHEGCTI